MLFKLLLFVTALLSTAGQYQEGSGSFKDAFDETYFEMMIDLQKPAVEANEILYSTLEPDTSATIQEAISPSDASETQTPTDVSSVATDITFSDNGYHSFCSENNPELQIDVRIDKISFDSIDLTFRNNSSSILLYGTHTSLYRKDTNGSYSKIDTVSPEGAEFMFLDCAYELKPGEEKAVSFPFFCYPLKSLEPGAYCFRLEEFNFHDDDIEKDLGPYTVTERVNAFDIDLDIVLE